MNHQLIWQQDRATFREDLYSSIELLQDITGNPVKCFRAPGFSIRASEAWAFEEIKRCGIEIDCSVFPAHHAHGGLPSYGQAVPSIIRVEGTELKEFPICSKELLGHQVIFSGGGYFRLFPYRIIKRWFAERDYTISYIHPRDLDAGQPMIQGLPLVVSSNLILDFKVQSINCAVCCLILALRIFLLLLQLSIGTKSRS